MLADVLEAAHDLLLAGDGDSTLRSLAGFTGAAPDYACLRHESSGQGG
jgi:hypothetical protein